jgi:hypothetical protein
MIHRTFLVAVLALLAAPAQAQFALKWLSAGSLHNWYSSIGVEPESAGFVGNQQDGWRWPGIYNFTDMQAAEGLWIGARNVTGPSGTTFPVRVVHAGPRVRGAGEFFPQRFEMIAQYEPPVVFVDGAVTEPEASMVNDTVDPDLVADRAIVTEVNTLLGLKMTRTALQFSNPYHSNYHIIEYVFENTGNTDEDDDIELPAQTLEDVYFYWQYRWSVARETRYLVGNSSGWGRQTMIDARGDGLDDVYNTQSPDSDFRAQFAWHGRLAENQLSYDNVGGPILREGVPAVQIAADDTLGRLGASQFIGMVVLHADASSTDTTDDRSQPRVMNWIHSDDDLTSNNDAFAAERMQLEYDRIMTADADARHAYVVEPTGEPGFIDPTGDPARGTSGGYSAGYGFGPYTIAPGETVRIVVAEAADGLSREANKLIGRAFKDAVNSNAADPHLVPLPVEINGVSGLNKNEWVLTSRDSLFQTFNRAIANFESGYQIQDAPLPPSQVSVTGGGDRITVEWETYPGAAPEGFEIWRAETELDGEYELVYTAGPTERRFDDSTPKRGINYFYYVVATGGLTDGSGGVPAGRPLTSSRYYSQTYTGTQLKRPAGTSMADIRVVPNPFYIGSPRGQGATSSPRFFDQDDKLAFYNVPGQARIQIFTELGELVDTIEHTDGSGDVFWTHTTSSRQVIVSGVYIAVITSLADVPSLDGDGFDFREGETAFRKFVVIR